METILTNFKTLDYDSINRSKENGITILMFFSKSDANFELVKALLENPNIDINKKNNEGKSAYDMAVDNKCVKNMELFEKIFEKSKKKENEEKFKKVFDLLDNNNKTQLLKHFCSFFDEKKIYSINRLTDIKDIIYFYQSPIFEYKNDRKIIDLIKILLDVMELNRKNRKIQIMFLLSEILNNNYSNKLLTYTKFVKTFKNKLIECDIDIKKDSQYSHLNLFYEYHHLMDLKSE